MVHLVQIVNGKPFSRTSYNRLISLFKDKTFSFRVPVYGGKTLEFCLAQFWSSLGQSEVSYTIEFHGILPMSKEICLNGCEQFAPIEVTGVIKSQTLAPTGFLKKLSRVRFFFLHNKSRTSY